MTRDDLTLAAVPTALPVQSRISTGSIGVQPGAEQGPLATMANDLESEAFVAPNVAIVQPTATEPPLPGTTLPEHRILLVYGLPGDESYGMLASYDNLRLIEFLQGKRSEYEAIDPGRPIKLGVQLVASAAQNTPGHDGSYLRNTSVAIVYQYIEFTRANDMLLFLDVQIGRRTVPEEVQRLESYLKHPHVHLGIDPQFDVGRTEIPTQDSGSTSAADIRWAQDFLANLSITGELPPKILIVHQLTDEMILNRSLLRPVRGVQLVINVTRWGSVEEKSFSYRALVADDPIEFGGIMISGVWDSPAMTTEDVINLPYAPEIVIYQ